MSPLPPDFNMEDYIKQITAEILGSPPKYYMIISSDFEIVECNSKEELVNKLRERREEERVAPTNSRAVMVYGDRVHLSKGEYKYVLFPDKTRLPLYVSEADSTPDEEGYLLEPSEADKADELEDEVSDPILDGPPDLTGEDDEDY